MAESVSVDFYGSNFTILVISAHTTCMNTVRSILEKKIQSAPQFFSKIIPVVINVSKINNKNEWFNLYHTISDTGLFIIGACYCHNSILETVINDSGLPILTTMNKKKVFGYNSNYTFSIHDTQNMSKNFKTQIIDTPIRSGQKIYAHNRDLIIASNVSAGAEIIADGNIHIYGTVKGRILAGASGNEESQIFCSCLFPELISIGGYYWLIDQVPQEFLGKSARFFLKNKALIIQRIL